MGTPRQMIALVLSLLLPLSAGAAPDMSAEARAIIEELNLREGRAVEPQRDDWRPRRVVVSLLPRLGIDAREFEEALRAVAGDVELVFDRSGRFLPDAELLDGADGFIGLCTAPALKRADATLRWLHNYSVGMDRCVGLSERQKAEVVFTNNQHLSAPAIAEHTLAMLLALARNLPAYVRAQAEGEWDRALARSVTFGELKGRTLLVAGLGGIGTEVARRAHGLGMRVVATRNSSREGPPFVEYVGLADELHKLAGEADVVVNALPLTEKTTGLFDKAFFEAVKPGAIFISVGRGRSTDTEALMAALRSGRLFGAGLDVTDPEPLPADHPLWGMERVIITPHVAAAGSETDRRTMLIAVENLRRYIAGEPMLNVVDIDRGY
ncbi:MAG: D-2-hydroxyacid dehydrogenase [Halioglobus sp.]|nr:D-2-hydroxyacid dehydrogenase [Halioglobus sp.]